jgi:predicted Zn-dependent peptidase
VTPRIAPRATLLLLAACGGGGASASFGPTKVELPVTDGLHALQDEGGAAPKPRASAGAARATSVALPASGTPKESPFPKVARAKLGSGMGLDVVTASALPIVHLRLLVRAGSGASGTPGVGELTAEMLKAGGTRALASAELLRRVETMGTSLGVSVDGDRTVISLAVTKDLLPDALALLGQTVREPRFDEGELAKLEARSSDAADDAARSSGTWTATWLVFREIFGAAHPYGTYALLPSMIRRIEGAQIRDFHRRFYVPAATTLVLAGDVDEATARKLADKAFGTWRGAAATPIAVAPPKPVTRKVVVAHRPKSVQSDVFVAMLAPARKSDAWASVRVANHVLGGGVASRLFSDVREQRSLAYRTNAQILELAHGPQPVVLYAGTQTAKTAQAVTGLLENATRIVSSPPTQAETETARRYLSDVFAVRMETLGAIADMVVTQEALGLPERTWDDYRSQLRATTAEEAARAAKSLYAADDALIVVAGDAEHIASSLATFGDVFVVDPEKEFKVLRTLPKVAR